MARTMRAQRLYADTKTVTVEDVPVPVPGRGEVLVKIAFCGICHSDVSFINGTLPSRMPVVTQGHEASGTIAELGADVSGWSVGDRVVLAAGRQCKSCHNCRRGEISRCQNKQIMSADYDGGWAEYALAQADGLTKVPDNVPLEQAAILADAVSTPFGAVVHTGKVAIGESVGVWGVGGLGTHLVQLAKLVGAVPIIAFDPNSEVRKRALELGADYAFDPTADDLKSTVSEATNGAMLDVAFDGVGISTTVSQSLDFLKSGGRLIMFGMSGQDANLGPTGVMARSSKQVLGHHGYELPDIETLAELVSRGRLDLSRSISEIIPLERISEGITKLSNHEGNPIRILVDPRRQ